jgi:hypothetical protein
MLLADPACTVPAPDASGPVGTMAWLRATVSRFASGETHTRRRALAEATLADRDPTALRAPATRRLGPDGRPAGIDLAGHPFGAGPPACPGEARARALAAGVVEGAR